MKYIIIFSLLFSSVASANWIKSSRFKNALTIHMVENDCKATLTLPDDKCVDITDKDVRRWKFEAGKVVSDGAGTTQANLDDTARDAKPALVAAKRGRFTIWCDGQAGLARDRCDLTLGR